MPQENSLSPQDKIILGRLEPTVWAALQAGMDHLASKADQRALSDLISGRSEEAVQEAMTANAYRSVVKMLKDLCSK